MAGTTAPRAQWEAELAQCRRRVVELEGRLAAVAAVAAASTATSATASTASTATTTTKQSDNAGQESAQASTKGQPEGQPERQHRPLSKEDIHRYSRQLILPELGVAGQWRLREASILVVGAGGLGAPCLLYLAAAGVGTLGIVDHDVVELSNLHRQVIHTEGRLGMSKSESARIGVTK